MAGESITTVIGNLVAAPELRFTPSGAAVASFTVASTPRRFDRERNEWRDGDTSFIRVNVWRQLAEHAAESFTKGDRVIVTGELRIRTYETRPTDGSDPQTRYSTEVEASEVGASVQYATVAVRRAARQGQVEAEASRFGPSSHAAPDPAPALSGAA